MFLQTNNKYLNAALGHPEKGLAYGSIIEISGFESQGKSVIAMEVATMAQRDDAYVVWLDLENSFDPDWVGKRGLVCSEVLVVQPHLTGKGKEKRISTAQELVEQVEHMIQEVRREDRNSKFCLVVDSLAAMLVEEEAEAGMTHQNMRTNNALPFFLSKMLRRWCALLPEYNAMCILINQIRTKPGMAWGNPNYTPGGHAPRFYAHVRAEMKRITGGRILERGQMVGIKGILHNNKNKAGGVERYDCGFRIYFNGKAKFMHASEIREEGKD